MSQCETCEFNIYDEDYEDYICEVNMDEDDYSKIISSPNTACPYYRDNDDYKIVRHQN